MRKGKEERTGVRLYLGERVAASGVTGTEERREGGRIPELQRWKRDLAAKTEGLDLRKRQICRARLLVVCHEEAGGSNNCDIPGIKSSCL